MMTPCSVMIVFDLRRGTPPVRAISISSGVMGSRLRLARRCFDGVVGIDCCEQGGTLPPSEAPKSSRESWGGVSSSYSLGSDPGIMSSMVLGLQYWEGRAMPGSTTLISIKLYIQSLFLPRSYAADTQEFPTCACADTRTLHRNPSSMHELPVSQFYSHPEA